MNHGQVEGVLFDFGDLKLSLSDNVVGTVGNFLMAKEQNKAMKQLQAETIRQAPVNNVPMQEEEGGKGLVLLLIGVVLLMVVMND